jgi:hypothetical protein
VDTTIINGRVIIRERDLPGIDEDRVLAASREYAQRFWERI